MRNKGFGENLLDVERHCKIFLKIINIWKSQVFYFFTAELQPLEMLYLPWLLAPLPYLLRSLLKSYFPSETDPDHPSHLPHCQADISIRGRCIQVELSPCVKLTFLFVL